jgi:hypothetical protein
VAHYDVLAGKVVHSRTQDKGAREKQYRAAQEAQKSDLGTAHKRRLTARISDGTLTNQHAGEYDLNEHS